MGKNLIVQARQGDEEALLELYYRYQPVVHSVRAKFFLHDFDEQDWFQEGLITFNHCLHAYKGDTEITLGGLFKRSFENVIVSLVRKKCAYKRKNAEGNVSFDQKIFQKGGIKHIEHRSYTDDPLEQLLVQETLEENTSLLTNLERRAFCGFFYGDAPTPSKQKNAALRNAYDRSRRKITQKLVLYKK
ncbi:MAG: sigma-70 family RNA polymerase sigma factor [Tetragenococcus halophilus]|nr:sigma-70 family RNA polymerase sigma factor [Tetragenococcus halophilus]MDN6504278.1 sigma-70 family RNA polymerase sigma factor [Tetragenococcus halophilus]MDN6744719.1 sigma-70 family RNA polymerase sigma factor [Tetragenococcus halophilus]